MISQNIPIYILLWLPCILAATYNYTGILVNNKLLSKAAKLSKYLPTQSRLVTISLVYNSKSTILITLT